MIILHCLTVRSLLVNELNTFEKVARQVQVQGHCDYLNNLVFQTSLNYFYLCYSSHPGPERSLSSDDNGAFGLGLQLIEVLAARTQQEAHEVDVGIFLKKGAFEELLMYIRITSVDFVMILINVSFLILEDNMTITVVKIAQKARLR